MWDYLEARLFLFGRLKLIVLTANIGSLFLFGYFFFKSRGDYAGMLAIFLVLAVANIIYIFSSNPKVKLEPKLKAEPSLVSLWIKRKRLENEVKIKELDKR